MIALIRHATPMMDYSRCSVQEARHRLTEYNTTPHINSAEIEDLFDDPIYQDLCDNTQQVYCSPIARAEQTCKAIFGEDNYVISDSLREVELAIYPLPLVKLTLKNWFLVSRVAWHLGVGAEHEKVVDARLRAKNLAENLMANQMAIVSHGYLIHYVKSMLMRRHYKVRKTFRSGCLTVELLYEQF